MKVSYNWLKEFVTIDLEPDLLAEKLTLSGAEVERVEKIRPLFAGGRRGPDCLRRAG